ncbi:hypothetical protein [Campylobacter jejuni]|uniref:hypothetical protein n=1 Tax=Campylobacter jejuni TaxID=197 RepID=UPI00313AEF3E
MEKIVLSYKIYQNVLELLIPYSIRGYMWYYNTNRADDKFELTNDLPLKIIRAELKNIIYTEVFSNSTKEEIKEEIVSFFRLLYSKYSGNRVLIDFEFLFKKERFDLVEEYIDSAVHLAFSGNYHKNVKIQNDDLNNISFGSEKNTNSKSSYRVKSEDTTSDAFLAGITGVALGVGIAEATDDNSDDYDNSSSDC